MQAEFVAEIYELLYDDSGSLNPLKDCECFAIKQKFQRNGKKTTTIKCYYFIMLSTYVVNKLFLLPEIIKAQSNAETLRLFDFIIDVLFVTTVILNAVLARKDPGFILRAESKSQVTPEDKTQSRREAFLELMFEYDVSTLCFDCEVLRTPRSRHCHQCNRCIDVFDHHCPWINNCVGVGNFKTFYTYIWIQTIYLAVVTGVFANFLFQVAASPNRVDPSTQRLAASPVSVTIKVLGAVMFTLSLVFMLSLVVLLFVQTTNIIQKETTAERYGKQRRPSAFKEVDNISNHKIVK